jgi:peptidoglycan/LPS O-acetylase OafA/YrhL
MTASAPASIRSGALPGAHPGHSPYRAEIDGLRAIAVGGVVAHHTGLGLLPGGFTGVDVFFVISGYLITGIIAAEMAAGRFSQWRFLERRVRRIVPAFAVMLAATAVAAWAILIPEDFRPFAQSLTASALFASNLLFAQEAGYFDSVEGMQPLLHTWTLGVEEQFYLLFPLVLIICRRWRPGAMLAVVAALGFASFALALGLAEHWPQGAFYLLPTRLWEFAIGAACALIRVRPRPRSLPALAGLAVIFAGFWVIRPSTPAPGALFLMPTLGTALVILFAAPGNAAGKLLSWRPLVWLGLVSFGTYLWHQPLLVLAHYMWFGPLPLVATLALVAGSVGLGAASYHILEQPIRQKRVLASRFWLLAICAGAILILSVTGLAGHFRTLTPLPSAEASRLDALRPDVGAPAVTLAADAPYVLFGDSHAGQYREALIGRFGEGALLTFPSCLAAPGVSNKAAGKADGDGCRTMPDRLAALVRNRKVRTIIWAQLWERNLYADGSTNPLGFDEGMQRLEGGMKALADRLPAGTRIILVGNVPTAGAGAPQLAAGWLRCRAYRNVACPSSYPADKAQGIAHNMQLRAFAERDPRFVYVDAAAPLCRAGQCLIVQDGSLNYWDPHHLTLSGARRVVAAMPALP